VAAAAAAAPAAAQTGVPTMTATYDRLHQRATQELGPDLAGPHIVRLGVVTPAGRREPRRRDLRRAIGALRGLLELRALALQVPRTVLDAIAECESGGDPTAVSAGGTYRGKYQFDLTTWRSVGGRGDPAAAPEPEQDLRAAVLYTRRGAQPWPVCGV
jgi:hypothetical protein